jgi:hypothetical protein
MNLDSMSEPEKERLCHWLHDQLGMSGWVSKMDNRELLWRLAEALKIDDLRMAGIEEALWFELENRLDPEYSPRRNPIPMKFIYIILTKGNIAG